ncbi:MAG: hypothetical protein ABFD49_05905 [Armatimonadota bacterium]|nr:hypothetical protein [bacterium]
MSEYSSSKQDVVSHLREYITVLEAKNAGLTALSQSSNSLKIALEHDLDSSIKSILKQRGRQCKSIAAVCKQTKDNKKLMEFAQALAERDNGDIGRVAQMLIEQQSKSDSLAEEVLACQKQCETLMKSRLDTLSHALKSSVQKRKLNAAYGPACKHATPTFMDKQS